jgi:hypothetical protein
MEFRLVKFYNTLSVKAFSAAMVSASMGGSLN